MRINRRVRERKKTSIEERYDALFRMMLVTAKEFQRELPEPEERSEFARAFPADFYRIHGFEGRLEKPEPAEIDYGYDVFRRVHFAGPVRVSRPHAGPTWISQHEPKGAFIAPDVRGCDWGGVAELAQARARWWIGNAWPVTGRERGWLWKNARELFSAASRCPDEE